MKINWDSVFYVIGIIVVVVFIALLLGHMIFIVVQDLIGAVR